MPEYALEVSPAAPYTLDLTDISDDDLSLIALQGTTPYGRQFLNRENEAAARAFLELDGYPPFVQSAKPTVRRDGSPLQNGDRWENTADQERYVYQAPYWLSPIKTHSFYLGTLTVSNLIGLLPRPADQIYLDSLICSGLFNGPQDTSNYWQFTIDRLTKDQNTTTAIYTRNLNDLEQTSGVNRYKLITFQIGLHQDLEALNASGFRLIYNKFLSAGSLLTNSMILRYRIVR